MVSSIWTSYIKTFLENDGQIHLSGKETIHPQQDTQAQGEQVLVCAYSSHKVDLRFTSVIFHEKGKEHSQAVPGRAAECHTLSHRT